MFLFQLVEFPVADLKEIDWNPLSFELLALPQNRKETILALAEARTRPRQTSTLHDIIPGKGLGLITLLQ